MGDDVGHEAAPRETTAPGLRTDRHVDLRGRAAEPWMRRIALAVLAALVVAAVLGAFGQSPRTTAATVAAGSLEVAAPDRLRPGLLYQARLTFAATRRVRRPAIALAAGWTEDMQLNTIAPAPTAEAWEDGRLVLEYDAVDAGDRLVVHLQFQVNSVARGTRSQAVEVLDGRHRVVAVDRALTVWP